VTTLRTGFESRQGQKIVLFSRLSNPALGPIQPTGQWELGWSRCFTGMKWTGRDVDRTHLVLR